MLRCLCAFSKSLFPWKIILGPGEVQVAVIHRDSLHQFPETVYGVNGYLQSLPYCRLRQKDSIIGKKIWGFILDWIPCASQTAYIVV